LHHPRQCIIGLVFVIGCAGRGPVEQPNDNPESPSSADGGDSVIEDAPCVNSIEMDSALPERLSETYLYDDILAKTLHPSVQLFTPSYELWSDGAAKSRYIYLPECETIDTSDMEDWSFPVGTRFFKEFRLDGQRIETRLITRTGRGAHDFLYASYVWNSEETEAILVAEDGLPNANETTHDIPSQNSCRRCHGSHERKGGRPSRGLGFGAMQLSHAEAGVTLDSLVAQGRLSHAPAAPIAFPGDAATKAALGYLHANCGTCHNDSADGVRQTDLNLWLNTDATSLEETDAYLTAVAQKNKIFNDQHVTARIEPGVPDTSSVIYRMGQRGNNAQMPPLGTEYVDEDGVDLIRSWILSLP
jgi:hypothetical protein